MSQELVDERSRLAALRSTHAWALRSTHARIVKSHQRRETNGEKMTTSIIAPDVSTAHDETTEDLPCLQNKNVGVVKNSNENVGVVENDSKNNKRKLGEIDFSDRGGTVTKKPHPCPPIKSSKSDTAGTNSEHSNSKKEN